MAKDGTNRGGARIGSGQKKKALADKILDGNPGNRKLTIMDFTDMTELTGESMPKPRGYLKGMEYSQKLYWDAANRTMTQIITET